MYKKMQTIYRQLLLVFISTTILCLIFSAESQAKSLSKDDFIQISMMGFGDPNNGYAWSMAWFKDKLYVGTLRNSFEVKALSMTNPTQYYDPYPVPVPDNWGELDLRAEIWQYTPETDTWKRVYQSPLITIELDGITSEIARDVGYRSMTVYTEENGEEALYIASSGPGTAYILRTKDGENFQILSIDTGVELPPDVRLVSFRRLVPFNGHLYTTPTATSNSGPNISEVLIVFESVSIEFSDEYEGTDGIFHFRPVSQPGFGDESNVTIFDMAGFNGYLYAGTGNQEKGYQIWKSDVSGKPPYTWFSVIVDGAYRGPENQGSASMYVFKDRLYVGSGIQKGGYDQTTGISGQPELIRINPDDTWQLICGEQRNTPDGLKIPLSGKGPGFDNIFNGYFWQMEEHEDWLYLGTMDHSLTLLYLRSDLFPPIMKKLVELIGADRIVSYQGGFDLWKTKNGIQWYPVTTKGLGNPLNIGLRTFQSTPVGLFLGTVNPLTVGDRTHTFPNLPGGAEVWLGSEGGLE
jgi:hypothetical protein